MALSRKRTRVGETTIDSSPTTPDVVFFRSNLHLGVDDAALESKAKSRDQDNTNSQAMTTTSTKEVRFASTWNSLRPLYRPLYAGWAHEGSCCRSRPRWNTSDHPCTVLEYVGIGTPRNVAFSLLTAPSSSSLISSRLASLVFSTSAGRVRSGLVRTWFARARVSTDVTPFPRKTAIGLSCLRS